MPCCFVKARLQWQTLEIELTLMSSGFPHVGALGFRGLSLLSKLSEAFFLRGNFE